MDIQSPEAIRLVIWDLDDTFWRGTLSEGGIAYRTDAHDIVVALARRGIVSSICSKNDPLAVRRVLEEHGVWPYFVFPSVDWQPKGMRIAKLIADVQLRPSTVLFIDDNPLNRNEALHYVPGLQVADESIIPDLLTDPRFRGKDDAALKRLNDYKLLESRGREKQKYADNLEFLRGSNIEVAVSFDVEPALDRIVDLINRTNQLNFTKRRLPEDAEAARHQLLDELAESNVQAGIVSVKDRYGDYGIVGFYLLHVHTWRLAHFCFSCRVLGMGVEAWVYERLRRPALTVVGDVLTKLDGTTAPVDWINVTADAEQTHSHRLGRVLIRGGCEMQAVAHYVGLDACTVEGEFNFERRGLPVPVCHSVFLRAAVEGTTDRYLEAAAALGFERQDFRSGAARRDAYDLHVYSFWTDAHFALHEDLRTGVLLPFGVNGMNNGADLRQVPEEELTQRVTDPAGLPYLATMRDRFVYRSWSPGIAGAGGLTLFEENLRFIFSAVPASRSIFVLLGCEDVPRQDGTTEPVLHMKELNRQTRHAAQGFSHVHLLQPEHFVLQPSDVHNATHFDRAVYHRIYRRILEVQEGAGAAGLPA